MALLVFWGDTQLVRQRMLNRFAEQEVEDRDKVHAPSIPGGVSQRGVKKKKDTSSQASGPRRGVCGGEGWGERPTSTLRPW